jgi:hypothetical protein
MQDPETKLAQLRKQLQELGRRWPKHSATMAMALEREALEEEIASLQKALAEKSPDERRP